MIDIERFKADAIEKLKPLEPEKIILFGSYAYGTPSQESDVDLLIVKDLPAEQTRAYKLKARKLMRSLIEKYRVGVDILVASEAYLQSREDYFYRVELLQKGDMVYE